MKKIKSLLLLVKSLFKKRRRVRVQLNLTRFNDGELLRYSESIIHNLTANAAAFPSPPLDSIQEAMQEMNEAMMAYEKSSAARASIHYLSTAREKLRHQLQAVASYFNNVMSNGSVFLMSKSLKKERGRGRNL